ncbi:sorting nexin-16-like isoform X2 [Notolabrus celidotus]|uniref:sorting nexin-16-like isoform X2 n=1 Tax=Notolabrus celidotus TaxID=1203425 RepID=UPI0014905B81|nr:sorting nexin-16-like isoform X2 [Notolabrus celidotus]
MAAPFVPVPFLVDQTEACKSLVKRKCGHPPTETSPSVSALRHWMKISTYFWRRPRGDMLDGMSAMLEGEGRVGDCWVERPITPTLLGYETLEERAKFTLKELYPSANLALPPKRWFKDNYNEEFLEERLSGLQMFLQSLALHKEVVKSEAVRRFLCLVDPPGPFDSLVESRAFCETLEETNHRLQRELLDNQREVDALKKILKEKENHFSLLVKKAKSLTLSPESLEGGRQLTETIAIHKNTHKEGDITVKGSEEQHNNESEVADDDTRISITEVVEESNHETSSYIYPLCYWY